MGLVEKAVYRAVLRKARLFDQNIAAKVSKASTAVEGGQLLAVLLLRVIVGRVCFLSAHTPNACASNLNEASRTLLICLLLRVLLHNVNHRDAFAAEAHLLHISTHRFGTSRAPQRPPKVLCSGFCLPDAV